MATKIKTALATSDQYFGNVYNWATGEEDQRWVYRAFIPMKRVPGKEKLVICNEHDNVKEFDDVDIEWHVGMKIYIHRPRNQTEDIHTFGAFTVVAPLPD